MIDDILSFNNRTPLELPAKEEYEILEKVLKKYKTDLVVWNLKLILAKKGQVESSITEGGEIMNIALNAVRSEILMNEDMITHIRHRMAEIYPLTKTKKE